MLEKLAIKKISAKTLIVPSTVLAIAMSGSVNAAVDLGDTVDMYGFLKLDATYQSDSMNSNTAPRFVTADGEGTTNLTAMHSRLGLKWTAPDKFDGWASSAKFEFDLFSPSRNQMRVRTRQAYFSVAKDSTSWLFGQTWDVCSPLGPTTFMTNGYLWNTGNVGFRRAQIRYTYKSDMFSVKLSANDPVGSSSAVGAASTSELPLWQGRLGLMLGKAKLGLSFASGEDKDAAGVDHDISGVSFDFIVPLGGALSVKGEIASGENLAVFLSRAGRDQDVISAWAELVYKGPQYTGWLGYATEGIDDADLAAATDLQDTTAILLGVSKKMGKNVSMGVEFTSFDSELRNGSSTDGTQIIFSAMHKI
ncbi:MAG: hypothetical protein JKX75_10425 [Gammaproteobacteria bacterium]|nr:hypothetical protein [Gammaproteobacteria bacterium]